MDYVLYGPPHLEATDEVWQDVQVVEPFISIVLPSYNEGARLPGNLEILSTFLNTLHRTYEIIVADDGSIDNTPSLEWHEYAKRFRVRYIRRSRNVGKGGAVKNGLQAARGKLVGFTDADLPVALEALTTAVLLLENNECDIVIGDRRLPGSKAIGSAPRGRHIASKLFNLGVQFLVLPGYTDTQCCLKMFNHQVLYSLLPSAFLTSYAFDVELLYQAKVQNWRIRRIPVSWKDIRAHLPLTRLIAFTLGCLKEVAALRLSRK